MAFNKRTWLGRQGTGLNKFSIGGASPVTIVNQPDSVTQVGDALSAGNLNDLEDRIADAFDETASASDVQNLQQKANALQKQIDNITEAEELLSEVDYSNGENAVPANVSENAEVSVLKGVGRVANNLMQYSTGYSQTNQYAGMFTHANALEKVNIISGHKYLFLFVQPAGCALYRQNTTNLTLESGGTWSAPTVATQRAFIATAGASAKETINSIVSKSETTATAYALSDMAICNLTLYFNGSIPTNAQTIADIQTNYPELLEPSDYNTGSVVFPTYSAVKSQGVNLLNPYAQQTTTYGSAVISDNGDTITITGTYFCAFACDLPAGSYYARWDNGSGDFHTYRILYKDDTSSDMYGNGVTATAQKEVAGLMLYCGIGTTLTSVYRNFQFARDDSSAKTTYHRYRELSTLTLPSPVTLKGAGSVAEEYYPETGRVTHPIGQVDLGTLGWQKLSQTFFYTQVTTKTIGSPVICDRYAYGGVKGDAEMASVATGVYVGYTTQEIKIKDDSLIEMSASDFKTAMSGVIFYYPLTTPSADTYIDPLPDNYVKVEPNGTIETVQSQSQKVDGAMTVTYTNKLSA